MYFINILLLQNLCTIWIGHEDNKQYKFSAAKVIYTAGETNKANYTNYTLHTI